MALRQATTEEIQNIQVSKPSIPISNENSSANSFHPTYSKLRVTSDGFTNKQATSNPYTQGNPQKSAIPKSEVKGGILGKLFTGNTQKFGKSIGESFALKDNVGQYEDVLNSHTNLQSKLLKAIAEKKKLGQDTTKLEDVLQQHIADTPKVEQYTGEVLNKTPGQIIGEGIGTGLETLSGGLLETGVSTAGNKVLSIGQKLKVPSAISRAIPKSEEIMQRVARFTPSDSQKFQKLAGKTHGEYLVETGNFGTPEQIIENEANKFSQSIKAVDTALDSLPGVFKSPEINNALSELAAREGRIGISSTESKRIEYLADKYNKSGLNMKEINEVKRLFERNVKLDFVKQNLPESIEKATRIDNNLRNWQFKKAADLGLKNLPELNKQTQLSKFIVDKLGKQLVGRSGNDAINFTDYIILAHGDPASIGTFITKKTFSNKGIQSRIAKILSKTPKKLPVQPEYGSKTGLPALIPERDYSVPIELPAPKKIIPFSQEQMSKSIRYQKN